MCDKEKVYYVRLSAGVYVSKPPSVICSSGDDV